MLICLVLCAAAVLPTAFSDRPEAQNAQPHTGRNSDMARRLAASYAAARNQALLRLQKYEGQPPDVAFPSLSDFYVTLWSKNYPLRSTAESDPENDLVQRNGPLTRSLDQIGGGHLLRRDAILDSIGGGYLLKRDSGFRSLDPIGGGHLLKRDSLDAIGGGNLLKRDALDAIGGGHLLKRDALDAIGGGNLLKRYALDSIGGGHLLKREFQPRQLDAIGGGHLLRRSPSDEPKEANFEAYVK